MGRGRDNFWSGSGLLNWSGYFIKVSCLPRLPLSWYFGYGGQNFVWAFLSMPFGTSKLLASSTARLGYMMKEKERNLGNSPLYYSLGPELPSQSFLSTFWSVLRSVFFMSVFLYNTQHFLLYLAGEKVKILFYLLEARVTFLCIFRFNFDYYFKLIIHMIIV